MAFIGICPLCGKNKLITLHHKFRQSKLNKAFYPEFIHHANNLQNACIDCHLCKKEGLIIWNEIEFCNAMSIIPRTKTGLARWERIKNNGKA